MNEQVKPPISIEPVIIAGRHINGIALNGYEFLLTDAGELKRFSSQTEAKRFMRAKGIRNLAKADIWLFYEAVCPSCGEIMIGRFDEAEAIGNGATIACKKCRKDYFIQL